MNKKYFYFLLFIFCSCDFFTRENNFIPDIWFYNTWNENTRNEVQTCCKSEELKSYLEDRVKRLFRYRAKLFEIIIKELPYEKNYFIEEYYSEGNDFSVHRMIVSTSKFGMEASINYKGKIKIEKVKLKPIMQVFNSKNCCPYTKEELENYDGHLPLKCITSIGVKKEATEFKTQISLN